jgi:di/tripeptidase
MDKTYADIEDLLKRIVTIPAPSGGEIGRARFICAYLNQFGAQASIDAVCNVLLPMPAKDGRGDFSILAAHTDRLSGRRHYGQAGRRHPFGPRIGTTPRTSRSL